MNMRKPKPSLVGNQHARKKGLAPPGMSTHPLFLVYYSMLNRERGITVCDRWLEPDGQGFLNFLKDMGDRPQYTTKRGTLRYMTLERKDNDKNYSPDNCIWATFKEQNDNQRITPKE